MCPRLALRALISASLLISSVFASDLKVKVLDPQSARYQDLAAKADAYIKPYKNIGEIEKRYKEASGSHYWLSGSDLGAKLATAADQYSW